MRWLLIISLPFLASCSAGPQTDCKKVAELVIGESSSDTKADKHEQLIALALGEELRGKNFLFDKYAIAYGKCRMIEEGNIP